MINWIKAHKIISVVFVVFFLIALSSWTSSVIGYLFICLITRWIVFLRNKIGWSKKKKKESRTVTKSDDVLSEQETTEHKSSDDYVPLPPIQDERKSECPYCHKELKKVPWKKKKCPHCWKYMYVRTWINRIKKVVTEKEAKEIDLLKIAQPYIEEWSFQREQARLKKQCGWEPWVWDILRWLYNQERMKHAVEWSWWLYRNTTHQMAEHLERENKMKWALKLYCHVCFYDINGATNSWWYGKPFDESLAFLASQVWSVLEISTSLGIKAKELEVLFLKESETIYNKYMSVTPKEWWKQLEKEFYKYS